MGTFNKNQLTINTTVQDRLRQFFATRNGSLQDVKISSVGLGDSDVNYELTPQYTNIKVIESSYNIPRIKYHLVYDGVVDNLTGSIESYIRLVSFTGVVSSYYGYPGNTTLTPGVVPPLRANQVNVTALGYSGTRKQGYIVFNQTLPDNYTDSSGVKLRLKEEYQFDTYNFPSSWELIIDNINGSFFLAKPTGYTFISSTGTIKITGKKSALTKTITFNI